MVEEDGSRGDGPVTDGAAAVLEACRSALVDLDRDVSDAERIDQLRALEELKSAAAAVQARIAVDLEVSQRAEQAAAGVPVGERGRGIGAQVALARRESPHRGGRLLGLAKALVGEMPHTYAALSAGVISEWRATLLVRESACLALADRVAFDAELAGDRGALERLGDKGLVARARQVAHRLDASSVVRRARRAQTERCVTIRPAPDTMSYLTGLLPVAQGVGVFAALKQAADSARAQGDARSRGQIMADTLVERITGQASAARVAVEVQVVMTDRALLAGEEEPACLPGYGTVPAGWARGLIADLLASDDGDRRGDGDWRGDGDGEGSRRGARVWLRRLFTCPTTGQLVQMDSRRRTAPPGLARFIAARDQTCRTVWCDAPVRHVDHIVAHAEGGATSAQGLQGYCESCNYTKQAPGWRTRAGPPGSGHVVQTTTPTGHRYTSQAPAQPGHHTHRRHQPGDSAAERRLADHYWAA